MGNDIEMYRGDTDGINPYLIDYSTSTPALVDLTGYTTICTVKRNPEDPDNMAVIPQKTATLSATTGTGTISSSGTTVTGTGTSFTSQCQSGDLIVSNGQVRIVDTVTSNTVLTTKGYYDPANPSITVNDSFSPVLAGASFKFIRTTISFSKTDTEIQPTTYVYDVKYLDGSGNTGYIMVGNFTILPTVTRKNS